MRLNAATLQSLLWLPAVLGGGFILVVTLGHWLYAQSIVGVRLLIGVEAIYLVVCAWALIVAVALAVRLIQLRTLGHLVWTAISVFLCLYFLSLGFNGGAAIVYAT